MNKNKLLFVILIFAVVNSIYSQTQDCAELKKQIDSTYNFKPSKLTETQRNDKSNKMDEIWEKVKADPKTLLPCLREEINLRTKDSFFKFDASNLLITLDQSAESKKLLIKSYAEVDFNDINLSYWMPYTSVLGYEGFDTSAAGENWLKFPKPQYQLPQHGTLSVNKEIGAIIIFGSMDESIATNALSKIANQANHPGREIAVQILIQQATPESFQELKKLDQNGLSEAAKQNINNLLSKPKLLTLREGEPKITRQQYLDALKELTKGKAESFMKLTIVVPDGEKDAVAVLKKEDIPLVRKARRFFAATANPHSADWYKSFTEIILTLMLKPETLEKNR